MEYKQNYLKRRKRKGKKNMGFNRKNMEERKFTRRLEDRDNLPIICKGIIQ